MTLRREKRMRLRKVSLYRVDSFHQSKEEGGERLIELSI